MRLTSRQMQITELLVRSSGSYKEIATSLSIQPGTMRKHVENIFRALRVHSRSELWSEWRVFVEGLA